MKKIKVNADLYVGNDKLATMKDVTPIKNGIKELQRTIVTDGAGDKFLSDDGAYKEITTTGTGVAIQGPKGDDGKSAYQIAVDEGYVGTKSEWLASLKGDKGETGPQGPKGDKGDPGEPADVSALATKTELELKADKTALDTLATKEELGLKANKTEIPDVTNLATKTELEAKLDKTQFESEKANFATKSELGTVNGSARVSAVEGNKLELKEDGLYANGISITDLDEVDTGALKEELQNIANEVTNKMSVFNELTELDLVELKTQLKTEIKAELKEEILAELNASRGPA